MGKRRGKSRLPDTEAVVFNGVSYTRRPGRKYFKTNRWDKLRKKYYAEALHQAVWKHYRGPIPSGYDVHHMDGNFDNNTIDNLELLTRSEHARLHDRFREFNATAVAREHRDRIRKLVWAKATYKSYVCAHCKKSFESRSRRALPPKFCSDNCGGLFRYYQKRNSRLRS